VYIRKNKLKHSVIIAVVIIPGRNAIAILYLIIFGKLAVWLRRYNQ